ncbi:MAG: G5 domain-containing protein [Anaerolineales bacterium]
MNNLRLYMLVALAISFLAACSAGSPALALDVAVSADGELREISLPEGSTVREALTAASLELGELDRVEPPIHTELADGEQVRVTRVTEEFESEQAPMPFDSHTLPNEALPVGEQRLIQNGANGLQETTFRLLYEDGELISRTEVDTVVLTNPVEEIIMIGAQSPFSSVIVPGRLAFISAGNAWVLEGSSGIRRAVAITGDLDGRIFEVSPDGEWLLFTRTTRDEGEINELWVASLDEGEQELIDLGIGNTVHFASWEPGAEYQIAYSTVQPTDNPPGWQANNDLQTITLSPTGRPGNPQVVLSAARDGFYAWWGTSFAWSPQGGQLAFARPDGVGTVNLGEDSLDVWFTLPAYQTGSDWAWIPGLSWRDEENFYYVRYAVNPVTFSLLLAGEGAGERIAENVGMFAMPQAAPDGSQVAFLRAFIPTQSDISTYELMIAAPSGVSIPLFPPEGALGLQPQRVEWSPSSEEGPLIAFVYEGNLWVVNVLTSEAQQLTGDGLVGAISWR